AEIGDGIDEHLEGEGRAARVAREQRHHRGEIAACAVAAYRELVAVHAQVGAVRGDPARGRPRVVYRGGELVLGGQTIVHRDHAHARRGGELAAEHVVGLEIAAHPADAVEVDVRGQGRARGQARR